MRTARIYDSEMEIEFFKEYGEYPDKMYLRLISEAKDDREKFEAWKSVQEKMDKIWSIERQIRKQIKFNE